MTYSIENQQYNQNYTSVPKQDLGQLNLKKLQSQGKHEISPRDYLDFYSPPPIIGKYFKKAHDVQQNSSHYY